MISVRREAERSLEGVAEVGRAQANQLCESRERYRLGEMIFDVGRDGALLPGCKATLRGRGDPWRSGIETNKLIRQDGAKRLEVMAAVGVGILAHPTELEGCIRHGGILEEQPSRQ